jgi:hypothetical protein
MWKQRANDLRQWLGTTQRASHGAKHFLQVRMGLRPALPWTPGHAFGLSVDEPQMICAPLSEEQGADPRGWD